MTESKKNLIDKLTKLYPYSKEWFAQKKETMLWAMLNSYKPPKKVVVESPAIKVIDGEIYIKADCGQWEVMMD